MVVNENKKAYKNLFIKGKAAKKWCWRVDSEKGYIFCVFIFDFS